MEACSGASEEKCDFVEDGYGKYEKICVEVCKLSFDVQK